VVAAVSLILAGVLGATGGLPARAPSATDSTGSTLPVAPT
jgi:hypothetical protein